MVLQNKHKKAASAKYRKTHGGIASNAQNRYSALKKNQQNFPDLPKKLSSESSEENGEDEDDEEEEGKEDDGEKLNPSLDDKTGALSDSTSQPSIGTKAVLDQEQGDEDEEEEEEEDLSAFIALQLSRPSAFAEPSTSKMNDEDDDIDRSIFSKFHSRDDMKAGRIIKTLIDDGEMEDMRKMREDKEKMEATRGE
jgi:hypothetical protein